MTHSVAAMYDNGDPTLIMYDTVYGKYGHVIAVHS